ncbi:Hydroxyethylthiazole kinase [Levilactobacillus zymae]
MYGLRCDLVAIPLNLSSPCLRRERVLTGDGHPFTYRMGGRFGVFLTGWASLLATLADLSRISTTIFGGIYQMKVSLLDDLRRQNPIVFNISNFVTVQDVANGINAIGASPIMSEEVDEADEMVQMSQAVCLNLGAFTTPQVHQIKVTGQLANQYHKPLVVDPVAVGAVKYRAQVAAELFQAFQPDVLRGNAGEIAALAGINWQAKGIDAGEGAADLVTIAETCAKKQKCTVILSGPTDVITDGTRTVQVINGTTLFQTHVGSGDMLSSIVAAFCAIEDDYFEAAQTACLVFAAIGQRVAQADPQMGAGTFIIKLMDALQQTTVAQIEAVAAYE